MEVIEKGVQEAEKLEFAPTLHSNEQIEKAKELLWNFVDEHNKKLLLLWANTNDLEKNGLEVKSISLVYQYKDGCTIEGKGLIPLETAEKTPAGFAIDLDLLKNPD